MKTSILIKTLSALTIVMTAACLNAQINFSTVTINPSPLGVSNGTSKFCDVDNDGDQDLFVAGTMDIIGPSASIYINDGTGVFTQSQTVLTGLDNSSSAFADIDGDGDQDLVYTGNDFYLGFGLESRTMIWKNDGTGTFTHVTVSGGVLATSGLVGTHNGSVEFGDADGDGDLDLLISGLMDQLGNDTTILYINDGTGAFTTSTGFPSVNAHNSTAKFADIDGDNDQDIFLTGKNSNSGFNFFDFLENDGNGNFTQLPFTSTGVSVSYSDADFSDIDNDGDLDLLSIGDMGSNQPSTSLYTNDGAGVYTLVSNTTFEDVHSGTVNFNDMDGDGDEDVVITGNNGTNSTSKLYENDGTGSFTEVVSMPFTGSMNGAADFADVDGDNDADLVIIGSENASMSNVNIYTNTSIQSSGATLDELELSISIYPNPSQNQFFIETIDSQVNRINILDLSGKVIETLNSYAHGIDVSNLTSGIYFIQVYTNKGISTKRFTKS